jgi:hypothetical protein
MKTTVKDLDKLRSELNELYRIHKSWREISRLGRFERPSGSHIPAGSLASIAAGKYEPKNVIDRKVLGLSTFVLAVACPECGIVHVASCPKQRQYHRLYDIPIATLKEMIVYRILIEPDFR